MSLKISKRQLVNHTTWEMVWEKRSYQSILYSSHTLFRISWGLDVVQFPNSLFSVIIYIARLTYTEMRKFRRNSSTAKSRMEIILMKDSIMQVYFRKLCKYFCFNLDLRTIFIHVSTNCDTSYSFYLQYLCTK